jgi:DMSO/TMAO reductase YedYZ heme-binding membrane subunit
VTVFSLAFGASALRRVWRSDASAWLLRNRRYVGVSFAVAHFLHLGALIMLGVFFPEPFVSGLDALTMIGGGTAYVLLVGMTATSFDRSAAWLGRKAWRRLHLAGSWTLWVIFAQSYLPRPFMGDALAGPFAAMLLAAFGLRVWVHFFSASRHAAAPSPG